MVLEVIESVNGNLVFFSSCLISFLINKPAVGAVEMWESGCSVPDFQARWKEWVPTCREFSTLSMGRHFHGARSGCSERSDDLHSLPPRFLRIDSPRISMR